MSNPFEQSDSEYFALVNPEGQYSLWPAHISIPDGWRLAHAKGTREECVQYIENNWKDMRPLSLIKEMRE
jgi:MbtH protein